MKNNRTKFISEVNADRVNLKTGSPFKLYNDKSRKYIRLEISEGVDYYILKDRENNFYPKGDGPGYKARILNLSPGGALIEGADPAEDGTMLTLKMLLQEVENLDGVIGVVKRCEAVDDRWLIGVEFVNRRYLMDNLSASEIDLIPDGLMSFENKVNRVLAKYVRTNRSTVKDGGNG